MALIRGTRRLPLDYMDAPGSACFGIRYMATAYGRGPFCSVVRSTDGQTRDIYGDDKGVLDLADAAEFAQGGDVDVTRLYDISGWSNRFMTFGTNIRPKLIRNGFVNTIGDRPIYVSNGLTVGRSQLGSAWNAPLVMNAVVTLAGAAVVNIMGVDVSVSGYRDTQLFTSSSGELGLGQDLKPMGASTSTIAPNTTSILTAVRNATGATNKGYIAQNGLITSRFTSDNVATDINPSHLTLFGDVDNAGASMPSGAGIQEAIWWNVGTPPSPSALTDLEIDQGRFYNIPMFGDLAWPAQIGTKLVASSGNPLATNSLSNLSYR